MPDTTTTGFITPEADPIADRALEDAFQITIRGITGIPGNLVRPQSPEIIANQPETDVDWVSFRIQSQGFDFDAHVNHQPSLLTTGASEVTRDETLDLVLSFYGPHAQQNMLRWVNGLAIDQNRWLLMDHHTKYRSSGNPVTVPALLKETWQRRIDLTSTFARRVKVVYPIRTVVEGEFGLHNERYLTPIIVQQP